MSRHPDDIPDFLRRDANNRAPWMDQKPIEMCREDFEHFVDAINNPKPPTEALKRLMNTKMPWDD